MTPKNRETSGLKQLGHGLFVLIVVVLVLFFGRNALFNPTTPGAQGNANIIEELTDEEQAHLDRAYSRIQENKPYSDEYDVAAYLHKFDELPPNYITKQEAEDAGWVAEEGNLWEVTDHKSIGGNRFENFEGNLPPGDYREADVNYHGGTRNAERLVYSTEGDIFYTENHYRSFTHFYQ